jgi:hypothetical protein
MNNMNILKRLVFFIFILTGCAVKGDTMTLEKDMVFNFKANEVYREGKAYLSFSGLCGHSAYAVEKVKIIDVSGGAKLVLMTVTSDTKGKRGDFSFEIEKKSGLVEVLFGAKKKTIWKAFE